MKNLPNILTTFRLICPIYFIGIICIFENRNTEVYAILFIFIFLSITDYLDGFLARKFNIASDFGKVFDPISDKILTSSALLYLSSIDDRILFPAILIIFREFIVSGAREFSLKSKNRNISVSRLAKIKTALQFFILSFLLIILASQKNLLLDNIISIDKVFYFFLYGLWMVTLLTLYTGYQYCYNILK